MEGVLATVPTEMARIFPNEVVMARRTAPWEVIETNRPDDVLLALSGPANKGPLLVVTDDSNAFGQIERRLGSGAGRPVYYLAGGKTAWVAYHAEQIALAAHTGQIFQTKTSIAHPIISGGCGSCGK